jgi:protease IV
VAAADEIATAILDVSEDDAYGAIVLRVDSPGGSPAASETIARALVRAREEGGKAIIVSMGPVAASGGYWIAAPADRIFATPTTLTGSIGVVGGKFILADMWDALRITWDGVQWGQNAGMWAGQAPFTPEQAARVEAMLDHVYDSFVARVAAGRGMTPEAVEAVARGRVWTGQQAAERGLVDELGGLTNALDYAAREVGADDRYGVEVDVLPRPPSPLEQFLELFGGSVRVADFAARLSAALDAPPQRAGAGAVWAYDPIALP